MGSSFQTVAFTNQRVTLAFRNETRSCLWRVRGKATVLLRYRSLQRLIPFHGSFALLAITRQQYNPNP